MFEFLSKNSRLCSIIGRNVFDGIHAHEVLENVNKINTILILFFAFSSCLSHFTKKIVISLFHNLIVMI